MAPCQFLFEFCAGDCGNGRQLKWKKYVCDDGNKDVYVGCC